MGEQDALVRGGGLEKVGLGKTNWLCAVHGAECDWPYGVMVEGVWLVG